MPCNRDHSVHTSQNLSFRMSNKDEMTDISHIETQPNNTTVDDVGGKIFTEKVPTKHDDAIDFLRSSGDENLSFSEQEAIRVRWKIDLLLMPLVCFPRSLEELCSPRSSSSLRLRSTFSTKAPCLMLLFSDSKRILCVPSFLCRINHSCTLILSLL